MTPFDPYMPYASPCGSGSPREPPEDPECGRQREVYSLARELLVTSYRGPSPIAGEAALVAAASFLAAGKARFLEEAQDPPLLEVSCT